MVSTCFETPDKMYATVAASGKNVKVKIKNPLCEEKTLCVFASVWGGNKLLEVKKSEIDIKRDISKKKPILL